MKVRSTLLASFVLFVFCVSSAFAVTLNYQGKLTDSSGNPENGTFSVQVNLYDEPSGGSPLFSETHSSVSVNEGIFSIIVGSVTPLDPTVFSSATSLFLGVSVNAEAELMPRHPVTHVGFAILADNAEKLDGLDSSSFSLSAHMHPGSDITSAVASATNASNSDLLDGLNSTAFADATHTHSGSDITTPVANATNSDLLDGLNFNRFCKRESCPFRTYSWKRIDRRKLQWRVAGHL